MGQSKNTKTSKSKIDTKVKGCTSHKGSCWKFVGRSE